MRMKHYGFALLASAVSIHAAIAAPASTQTPVAGSKGEILVLLSSESQLPLQNGKTMQTGYYLNEFGVPADVLLKAGYKLVIATPKGNKPPVDPHSVDAKFFGGNAAEMARIQTEINQLPGMQDSESVQEVLKAGHLSQYKAVFIPGGHAPLIDLMNNRDVGKLLTYFHQHKLPTAAICHGPITLLSAQKDPQGYEDALIAGKKAVSHDWIYRGYHMTIFSKAEEQQFESSQHGNRLRFYPETAITTAGGKFSSGGNWHSHVVVDRELITGQNPMSDHELVQALLLKLQQKTAVQHS